MSSSNDENMQKLIAEFQEAGRTVFKRLLIEGSQVLHLANMRRPNSAEPYVPSNIASAFTRRLDGDLEQAGRVAKKIGSGERAL